MSVSEEEVETFLLIRRKRELDELIAEYEKPGDLLEWTSRSVLVLLRAARESLDE